MTTPIKVTVPLSEIGPVEFDATTNALQFALPDTGIIADGFGAVAQQLRHDWTGANGWGTAEPQVEGAQVVEDGATRSRSR